MTALALFSVLALSTAAEPQLEAQAPRLAGQERVHLSLISGPSFRSSHEIEYPLVVDYEGAVPPQLKLAAAVYFLSWLGVAADGSAEWFSVAGSGFNGQDTGRVSVAAYQGSLALTGRYASAVGLALEVRLGYALGLLPSVSGAQGPVVSTPLFHHSPILGAAVSFDRGWPVSAQLRGIFAPFGWGSSAIAPAAEVHWYGAGLEVDIGRLPLLGSLWSLVLDYEFRIATANAANYRLEQQSHRLALGVKTRIFDSATPGARYAPPQAVTGSLLGNVVSPEGKPIAGATVEFDGATFAADEAGRFRRDDLHPGSYPVAAQAPDFKRATQTVTVAAGGEAALTLVLPRPSGPGVLSGSVRIKEPDAPAAGAVVTVKGLPPVEVAADGTYRVEGAGPGAVSVTVAYAGYVPVEEAVQVPAESTATLDVKLENKRPMAKLRGRVIATNASFKATVSVIEAKQKLTVTGDGRFSIDLPGGTYKVVVEAPGYLTQSRVVNLADGDHTIYYFELRPSQ